MGLHAFQSGFACGYSPIMSTSLEQALPMSGPSPTYRYANGIAKMAQAKEERGLYRLGMIAAFCTLALSLLGSTAGFFVWALGQERRMTIVEQGIKQEHDANAKQDTDTQRENERAEAWRIRMEKKMDDLLQSQRRR